MERARRLVGNAASMLASDVVNRGTTFVLYALVARFLGAYEFGQLSIALALFYTFQIFAVAGLKTLVTREVSKNRALTSHYLYNGTVIVIATSLASLTTLAGFVWIMGYPSDTAAVILLLSLALFPYSMAAVCDGIFQAWEKMHFIAIANIPANVIKLVIAFLLLTSGYGIIQLISLLVASYVLIVLVEWALVLRLVRPGKFSLKWDTSLALVKQTRTFFGIDGLIAIGSSMNVILLSVLVSEREVGLFSSANQLIVPVSLVFQSIVLAVFPIMSRRWDPNTNDLAPICSRLLEILLSIAIPTAVGLFFLAEPLIRLLYGSEDLVPAATALRIVGWSVIAIASIHALGYVLIASSHERMTLRIVAINTLIALVVGLALISQFGYVGAAISMLTVNLVSLVQHYIPVARLLGSVGALQAVWKAGVASIAMAGFFVAMEGQNIWAVAVTAGLIYLSVLFLLTYLSVGGPEALKARYLEAPAEWRYR